jgi:hypothetical protein
LGNISRANLTPAHPHTIDLYTKGGAAVGYEGIMGIIDQYGLGFVILTAGSQGVETQIALQGALLKVLMPAVEEATRAEAQIYTGTYSTGNGSISSTGSDTGGSMKIEIDNGLGLRLKELTRNGSDIIEAIKTLWNSQSVKLGNLTDELRLYPTDVVKKVQVSGYGNGTGKVLLEEDWRLQYDSDLGWPESELPVWTESEPQCVGWQTPGWLVYAGESLDRFIFVRDGYGGPVVEARVPSLKLNLTVHK